MCVDKGVYLLKLSNGWTRKLWAANVASRQRLEHIAGVLRLPTSTAGVRDTPTPSIVFMVTHEPARALAPLPSDLDVAARPALPTLGWTRGTSGWASYWMHPETGDTIIHSHSSTPTWLQVEELLAPVYAESFASGGLAIHCAIVALGSAGFLLSGPSGIGKSTAAQRVPAPWRALCDDRALAVPTGTGHYALHPLPTAGSLRQDPNLRWCFAEPVELRGLAFLSQVPHLSCEGLAELPSSQAMLLLVDQALKVSELACPPEHLHRRKETQELLLHNCCEIVRQIPSYLLRVCRYGRFWCYLEDVSGTSGPAFAR